MTQARDILIVRDLVPTHRHPIPVLPDVRAVFILCIPLNIHLDVDIRVVIR